MTAQVIYAAMLAAIAEHMPQLRKGSIDDVPDAIVKPSVTIHILEGKPEWNGNGTVAQVKCSPQLSIVVMNMKSAEDRKCEALAIENVLMGILHGLEPDGCDELDYAGWKDTTSQSHLESRLTVIQVTFNTAYEINTNEVNPRMLDAIWTSYTEPETGKTLLGSTENFEHGETP